VLARFLLAAALLATACAGPGALVAPTGEHRLTAHDTATGITAIVTTGVWTGAPEDLDREWTVVHLLVANLSEEPILLAPGDFELRDLRGFHYELIDPGATFHRVDEGSPREADYGRQYRRDYDPGGPVEFTPMVPPGDVGKQALPWGVLQPGTQMRGFLYFESVTGSANGARLTWRVTDPEHRRRVDLRFDFVVAR
jgi:hypothetical protein